MSISCTARTIAGSSSELPLLRSLDCLARTELFSASSFFFAATAALRADSPSVSASSLISSMPRWSATMLYKTPTFVPASFRQPAPFRASEWAG